MAAALLPPRTKQVSTCWLPCSHLAHPSAALPLPLLCFHLTTQPLSLLVVTSSHLLNSPFNPSDIFYSFFFPAWPFSFPDITFSHLLNFPFNLSCIFLLLVFLSPPFTLPLLSLLYPLACYLPVSLAFFHQSFAYDYSFLSSLSLSLCSPFTITNFSQTLSCHHFVSVLYLHFLIIQVLPPLSSFLFLFCYLFPCSFLSPVPCALFSVPSRSHLYFSLLLPLTSFLIPHIPFQI